MAETPATLSYKWHVFIVHAGADKERARDIRRQFRPKYRVFIDDPEMIEPGHYGSQLRDAQGRSLISAVCVSRHLFEAHYAMDEITNAISLMRANAGHHRIVTLYLDGLPQPGDRVPYGLGPFQGYAAVTSSERQKAVRLLEAAADRMLATRTSHPVRLAGARANPLAPATAPSQTAHQLAAYPEGPLVRFELIDDRIPLAYATLFTDPPACLAALNTAARLRREEDKDAKVVRQADVPAPASGAAWFWREVFRVSTLHGPRMVAALLESVPPDQFNSQVRAARDELLAVLREYRG